MQLDELNTLDAATAARALLRCCGSSRWAARMAELRPFADAAALSRAADRAFDDLGPADWLEAFAAHPKIGAGGSRPSEGWSGQEQALVAEAANSTRQRLADANRDYEARFGYIFIVCATGKSGAEMLELLERRLDNDPGSELRIAASEQKKITHLRLTKLLGEDQDMNR
jgi:OHCU decarboxylase